MPTYGLTISVTACLLLLLGVIGEAHSQPGNVGATTQVPSMNLTGAASDGKTLWVADRKADVIHSIDLISGKPTGSFKAPGFRPVGLAFDGEKLWIGDLHFLKAFQVDLSSHEVVAEIPLPGSSPRGLAHDGTHLWVADHKEGRIFKISTSDGTIVHDFEVPAQGITGLTWHDGWLWSAGRLDDELYMIDPNEGLVVNVLPSPGPYPWGLAATGSKLLCADYQNGDVAQVDIQPAERAWVRSEPKEYKVTYTIDLYNYGEDALTSAQMWVALPEERENQELLSGPAFSMKPHDKFKTTTGQKYARWLFGKLAAPGKLQVAMTHGVRLHNVDWFLDPRKVKGTFPKDIKKVYLADSEKYLIDHPYIQKIVTAVVGDEKNPYWKARRLFEWEIEKLEYKLAGGHENAPKVLQRGNGSCSEYTFSFVSLCRAAGVPARYVGSIVVRKDDASVDDVFHRWAEVYLPPYGWVPVDVNHGDKPDPRGRALGFGHLTNNLLVTTVEGPQEENRLGWSYNSSTTWTYKGTAKVYEEPIAEWRPLLSE